MLWSSYFPVQPGRTVDYSGSDPTVSSWIPQYKYFKISIKYKSKYNMHYICVTMHKQQTLQRASSPGVLVLRRTSYIYQSPICVYKRTIYLYGLAVFCMPFTYSSVHLHLGELPELQSAYWASWNVMAHAQKHRFRLSGETDESI